MLSNFDQINFSACKVGAHKNQPLSRVCVDKNCEQRSFICYTCEQEIHLGHRTLALKEFLQEIDHCRFDPALQGKSADFKKKVKEQKVECLCLIAKFKEDFAVKFDRLSSQVGKQFDMLEQSVTKGAKQITSLQANPLQYSKQISCSDGILAMSSLISSYHEYKEYTKPNFLKQIEEVTKQVIAHRQTVVQTLESVSQKLDEEIDKITESLGTDNRFQIVTINTSAGSVDMGVPVEWCSELKHTDIQCNSGRATRQGTTESSLSVAVAIQDKLESARSWVIKIINKIGFIGIGICLETTFKAAAFKKIGWLSTGHGNYVIWEDGQVHSHIDSAINGKRISYSFTTGDTIYAEYIPDSATLTLTKNRQRSIRWSFEIPKPPQNQNYRPCIYLYKKGDSVEVARYK